MKNIITLFALVATCLHMNGQVEYTNFKDSDSEATQILDQLYRYISEATDYTVDFSLTLEYSGEQPHIENGKLSQAGDNYILDLDSQTIYASEATQWTHLKEENEVLIDSRDQEDIDENLSLTPLGLLSLYRGEDFVYAILNTEPFESSTRYFIEFKPLDDYSDYSKIRVNIVDHKVPNLEEITVFNKDGSRYVINIDEMLVDQELTDEYFQFDKSKHPGIHIEDVRL